MTVEIINIGDELLIGQVVNTNATWLAEQFTKNGFIVIQTIIIQDSEKAISKALNDAQADILVFTGGLGPTKDDITKKVVAKHFDSALVLNEASLENIKSLFLKRNFELTELNRQQAFIPKKAIALQNPFGTAPGIWINDADKNYFFLPGVPYEMKNLISTQILPELMKKQDYHYVQKTILTMGMGESFLVDRIADWENNLDKDIMLAYLPSAYGVRIRLSMRGKNKQKIENTIEATTHKLQELIPELIYAYDEDRFESIILEKLKNSHQTLSTAESCTGGKIAHLLTSIPGSSSVFKGSIIAYSNEIKEQLVEVNKATLENFGAVSEEVVIEMAENTRRILKTDYSIAVSGIAGPDGGSVSKPVGFVWIAVADKNKTIAQSYNFGNSRERNIDRSANTGLNMLLKLIAGEL